MQLNLELAGKKVLVIGAARSGIACAKFLVEQGATVALNDEKPIEKWGPEAIALKDEGVGCLPGEAPSWLLDNIDLVVISPGVPVKSIPVRYADRAGVEVIGEVELASRFLKGRTVAITGTNGKTTTTALIGELLKDAGLPVQVGGNIGTPLITLVEELKGRWLDSGRAVELSVGDDQGISSVGGSGAERYAKSYGSLRGIYRLRRCQAPDFYEPGAWRRGCTQWR